MKQCEPLKELLIVPKECPPCPPGLGSRRLIPMGHVGIVASEPVAGASDLVAVDVRTQEPPKVFILREQYDKLGPAVIREKHYGGASIGKGHKHIGGRQDPKDYAKKKKAKRRQQKQARRRNK